MITLILLLSSVSSINQGWIFNHGIELPPRLAVLQPASDGKLLMSSDQSLNLTTFTSPNSIERVVATCFDQQIEFTYTNKGNEVIFIDQNLIYFVPLAASSSEGNVQTLQHNSQHPNTSGYDNFISPSQIIRVTTPVAVTQDYQAFAFAGFTAQDQLIEIWTNNPKKFKAAHKVANELRVDRLYIMQDQLKIYLISDESLFLLQGETVTKIRQDVHFCSVKEASELICKLCGGDIAIINSNFSHIVDKPKEVDGQRYANMAVSLDGQLLVQFGNDENFIVSNLVNKTVQTREQLSSTQDHISKVAISSDGQSILTYNCVDNSAVLWQFGSCQPDKQISEGFCKCKGNLLDFGGSCGCSDGQYADDSNSCQKCNFFCTNCQGSQNSCTEVNVGGVLMIICACLVGILIALLIVRAVHRKKAKKVELTAQLLESITTEKV